MSNKALLIVNDDDDIAKLFAAGLEHEGFKTVTLDNASSAFEKIKTNPDEFSLVLVDHTSQQNGDFAKSVKGVNAQIKVILTSGFAFNDYDTSESGYDKFLRLPITLCKLVSTVREVLPISTSN